MPAGGGRGPVGNRAESLQSNHYGHHLDAEAGRRRGERRGRGGRGVAGVRLRFPRGRAQREPADGVRPGRPGRRFRCLLDDPAAGRAGRGRRAADAGGAGDGRACAQPRAGHLGGRRRGAGGRGAGAGRPAGGRADRRLCGDQGGPGLRGHARPRRLAGEGSPAPGCAGDDPGPPGGDDRVRAQGAAGLPGGGSGAAGLPAAGRTGQPAAPAVSAARSSSWVQTICSATSTRSVMAWRW